MTNQKDMNQNELRVAAEEMNRLKVLLSHGCQILDQAVNKSIHKAQEIQAKRPTVFSSLSAELKRVSEEHLIERTKEALEVAISDAWADYKTELEAALHEANIPFSGTWPQYHLHSMIKVKVDLDKNKVELNDKPLRSADIRKVIELARKAIADLIMRPFDLAQWLETLENICPKYGIADTGEFVDIRTVRKALRDRYGKRYSDQHLGIDLVRLMDAARQRQLSMKIEVSPARNPNSSVYLPGPNGGFISGLRIVAIKDHKVEP